MLMSIFMVCQFESETQMVIAIKTYTNIRIKVIAGDKITADKVRSEKRPRRGGFSFVQRRRFSSTRSGVSALAGLAVGDFIC